MNRSLPGLLLGLSIGIAAGFSAARLASDTSAISDLIPAAPASAPKPERLAPESPGHYAIGFSVAEDAGLKGFNWSASEVDDFVSGMRDSLQKRPSLVPGKPAEYASLHQKVIDQIHPDRGASKKLPATLAPLLEAYRDGAYAHNLRIGADAFPEGVEAIHVRFTSAFIDQTGRPTGEISSDMVLRLESIDPGLRRTLERARVGGRITAVIPARFLGSSELIRSQVHPDESIVYTLLLDLPKAPADLPTTPPNPDPKA